MRLAVTGAAGFVGRAVVAAALARPEVSALTVTDRVLADRPADPRLRAVAGDICDTDVQAEVWDGADAMIHLAAVLGGAAEADPAASRRVNLGAALDLMERADGRRFVLASTIAVYGAPPPRHVNDLTPCAPRMVYAIHKCMAEVALQGASLRGEVDGLALRIPGVVPRPGPSVGLKSAFLSDMFIAARAGQPITLPVTPQGRTWIASPGAVAAGLVHAALLPTGRTGAFRSFAMPALAPTMAELVAAVQAHHPGAPLPVWEPDPAMTAGFADFGTLDAAHAHALGFPADADLAALVGA